LLLAPQEVRDLEAELARGVQASEAGRKRKRGAGAKGEDGEEEDEDDEEEEDGKESKEGLGEWEGSGVHGGWAVPAYAAALI